MRIYRHYRRNSLPLFQVYYVKLGSSEPEHWMVVETSSGEVVSRHSGQVKAEQAAAARIASFQTSAGTIAK